MLLRGANAVGYTSYADNVVNEFCRQAKLSGVDIFRVFDSLNYIDNLKFGIDSVTAAGGIAEGTICYTGDLTNPARTRVRAQAACVMCCPAMHALSSCACTRVCLCVCVCHA
jgi:pyruvate carboxylase